MISYGELFVIAVYAAMAGYIVYLQHKLKQSNEAGAVMAMVLRDIAHGELNIEGYENGFKIVRKQGDTGETSLHQREPR